MAWHGSVVSRGEILIDRFETHISRMSVEIIVGLVDSIRLVLEIPVPSFHLLIVAHGLFA